MLFWRFFIAVVLLGVIIGATFNSIAKPNARDVIKVFLFGAAFYSLSSIAYFISSEYIGSGLAMVICYSAYPAMIIFLNWLLFRNKAPKAYYLVLVCICAGITLLANPGQFKVDVYGSFMGIISALFYAFYIVFSKKNELPPLLSSFVVSLGCMVTCFIFALVEGTLLVPTSTEVWLHLLGVGVICTALPILLLLQALKHINSDTASLLAVLEPVFVVIFGILLLGETLTLLQILGSVILIAGGIITITTKKVDASLIKPIVKITSSNLIK
ncbi:MAG: DMT family transporter, partial [Rickettsiales bacterium]